MSRNVDTEEEAADPLSVRAEFASEDENEGFFWRIRGGGSTVGSQFERALCLIDSRLMGGVVVHESADARGTGHL